MQPVGRLPPQPWMTAHETRAVLEALTAGGADARFVGGCVRDAWLGRAVKDIDIATHAPPGEVIGLLERAGLRAIPTGVDHGTVTAVAGRKHFEITTLRRDVESYGRHARVEFTDDWKEDAARRDFTMNALSATAEGVVYDPFGGLADLAQGRVRFVGEAGQRLAEDVLRLLRFFRFFATYGRGAPDAEALAACRAAAVRLPGLSGERIRGEIYRLLGSDDPAPVWRLMIDQGVMAHLLPRALNVGRLDRMVLLQRMLGEGADPTLRLAAVLADGRAVALNAAAALRLSNAERDRLAAVAEPRAAFDPAGDLASWRRARYRLSEAGSAGAGERFGDVVRLAAVAAPGPRTLATVIRALAVPAPPAFPLGGREALALGAPAGPKLGRLLRRVELWWTGRDFQDDRAACAAEFVRLLALDGDQSRP